MKWLRARAQRKKEQQIAQAAHPSARIPDRFYTGTMPTHDDVPVLMDEEIAFAWITDGIKGGQEGRRQ